MVPTNLSTIAGWVKGQLTKATGKEIVSGVCSDSNQIKSGDLFVGLKGEKFDGHDFIADAFQKGAVAVLVNRPSPLPLPQIIVSDTLQALGQLASHYLNQLKLTFIHDRPLNRLPIVIAVTGSNGKTTTKEMVGAVLKAVMTTVVAPESYNNEVGVPLTVLQLDLKHHAIVMEYAMRRKGDIAYLCRIAKPDIAVITNIGTAHIGLLSSRRAIAEAKSEILNWDGEFAQVAILPANEDFSEFLQNKVKGETITFGFSPGATVEGIHCEVSLDRTLLKATDGQKTVTICIPALGEHNARNALAALSVAKALGIDWDIAVNALENFTPPKMRLQRQWLDPPGCWVINDAYNANPDSVKAGLKLISSLPAKRKVAVVGEMLELGEFHEQGHQEVGRLTAETVNLLIVVGINAYPIVEGAKANGMPSECIVFFDSLEEAEKNWRLFLQPDDLILLKASRAVGLERILND